MRVLLLLLALPLLTTFAPKSLTNYADIPKAPWLWVERVPLRTDAPESRRIGGLIYLEGWALRSNHPYFGGISAMHVTGRAGVFNSTRPRLPPGRRVNCER